MNIIFCEECGGRNVIGDEALQNIATKALPCQVCNFPISPEHIINHTGAGKVIDTSTYKLLIIDDDQAHLNLLQASLHKEYTVTVASSGEEGIEAATNQDPDLILLDVSMPGLDGYEVCSQLKGTQETRHIPIIFVTAKTEGDNEYKGLSLGAVDYIFKPFNLKILNAKIGAHLKFNAMRDELRQKIEEQEKTIKVLKHDILDDEAHMHNLDKADRIQESDNHYRFLEQEKHNLENILNRVSDIVTIHNKEHRVVWANQATLTVFNITLPELQKKTCYELFYDKESPCSNCLISAVDGVRSGSLGEVYHAQLNMRFVQISLPMGDGEGEMISVAYVGRQKNVLKTDIKASDQGVSTELSGFINKNYGELNDVISTILVSSDAICNMYKEDKHLVKLNEYIADASNRLRILFKELRNSLRVD